MTESEAVSSVRYSVCITHYNQADTLASSLQTILRTVPNNTEVVIIDAGSSDGSLEILDDYSDSYPQIRYEVHLGCNRGKGRDIALRTAHGEHIIANYDLDQKYEDILPAILDVYSDLQSEAGPIALRTAGNLFIAPKELLLRVGGYSPLMRGEDHELTDRLEDAGALRYLPVRATENLKTEDEPLSRRIRRGFRSSKAFYRIGFTPSQIFLFLYTQHPLLLAVAGTPVYVVGIVAGIFAGKVYSERDKHWKETFEMSARPTYEEMLIPVPEELKKFEVKER